MFKLCFDGERHRIEKKRGVEANSVIIRLLKCQMTELHITDFFKAGKAGKNE